MERDRPPLSGIRAVELGHIVAGPSGGLLLADLGADVIKVEEPRAGDQSRAMPNRGSTFYAFNRNKRSLAVDLKSEGGREIFGRLVRIADIVLDNYAPGVLSAWESATSGAPASTRASSTARSRGSCPDPTATDRHSTSWPR